MKKIIISMIIILFISTTIIYPVFSEDNYKITVLEVKGEAKYLEKNIITDIFSNIFWLDLNKGDTLKKGDKIKTSENTKVEIYFSNNSYLKIDENTQLTIEENKNTEKGIASSVEVKEGKVWTRVKDAWQRLTKFEVITPSAVAGVKGTSFSVEVNKDKSILSVNKGSVEFSSRENKESKKVLVATGEFSEANDKGVSKAKKMKQSERKEWHEEEIKKWLKKTEKNPGKAYGLEIKEEKTPDNNSSKKGKNGQGPPEDIPKNDNAENKGENDNNENKGVNENAAEEAKNKP
ncbi:MAG: FecR family protein [Bacillota bacterium]